MIFDGRGCSESAYVLLRVENKAAAWDRREIWSF